jgi:predicted metalloprotease
MEWTPGGSSEDLEDRRDDSGGGGGGGFGFGHLGIGGILIVGLLSLLFHQNFFALLSGGGAGVGQGQVQRAPNERQDRAETRERDLMVAVLNSDQRNWDTMLPAQTNVPYHHAKLVLFRGATQSACGVAQDATGPFYCPADEKVYLDLGFFDELKNRFGGSNADFAQAYVVAHELGHHVQKLLGTEAKVTAAEERHPDHANALSVALELQADCFAGVWANSARDSLKLNQSDIQAALSAAAAVGDDHLQKMATGTVMPEKFTHGTSAQREEWFTRGYQTGLVSACNTFRR